MTDSFNIWDQSIHNLPDQQKRIASAKKAGTSPTHIDKDSGTGVFPSSGKNPYQTTFSSCTCVDFSTRHLPCKHMYRLAIECGQFEGIFTAGENKNTAEKQQFSLQEAIAVIEKLTEVQQKRIGNILRDILYGGLDSVKEVENSDTAALLTCPLISCIGTVDVSTVLDGMRKKDIVLLLEKHGCAYDTKLKKADLAKWCVENAPNIFGDLPVIYVLTFSNQFKSARRKVYSYLLRKFDWDYYLKGDMVEYRYPHGSVERESGRYWFPDDDITWLLTKYGCNRCLDGFAEEKTNRAVFSSVE